MNPLIMMNILVFIFGICIGSFLNVCIFRIPEGISIVTGPSHCPNCEKRLKWYDMFPIFSWLVLRGKCRFCGEKISVQYPIIEAICGILWVVVFNTFGLSFEALLGCLLASCILALSVIDERTQEIPVAFNIAILILAIFSTAFDTGNLASHIVGAFAISVPLLLIQLATKGRGIGGGDIKLMAVCGLYLGWQRILLAFFLGCLLGSVIHLLRMKLSDKEHILAFGPYLSLGVFIALVWGNTLIDLYLGLLYN